MGIASSSRMRRHANEESLLDLLARAHHLVSESFHRQVKRQGVSPTEWRIIAVLADRDGTAMTELAELVMFKQPTLTKAIDRMERSHLVRRHTPNEDRRRTLIYLTERGRRIAMPLLQRARQHELAVLRALGDATSHALRQGLARLIEQSLAAEMQLPASGPSSATAGD